jgi:hypothetical protein
MENEENLDDVVVDQETIKTIRGQLASNRNRFKNQLNGKPLQEQRLVFSQYLKSLLILNGYTNSDNTYAQVKDMIEDFLFYYNQKGPMSVSSKDWKPWLLNERKQIIKWDYSNRYLKYLTGAKGWNEKAVDSIDICTDDILNHCGDPLSKADFCRKGLVIGDIQSGKTANYTSLINKAIDCGYKIIIVLTGTTNDLRSQTQKRLDKEVAGFKTDFNDDQSNGSIDETNTLYGVAQFGVYDRLQVLTNASINGDLKKNIGVAPVGPGSSAFLTVIKKNKSSLNAVIKFLKATQAARWDSEGKMPFPVLLIDDEADLASINTNANSELKKATGTNRLIRQILFKTCRKFTYVGYTATPFANIFIAPHDKNIAKEDSDDIFPDNFIITLPTPPGYSGPSDFFGINEHTQDDDRAIKKDLFVRISKEDAKEFFGYEDPDLPSAARECVSIPQSLRDAVMCFLISTGTKISRNIIENCTMLVNVNTRVRFNYTLRDNVKQVFDQACRNYLNDEGVRERYRLYWEQSMRPVSIQRLAEKGILFNDTWEKIDAGIREAISWKTSDSVKLIVGTSYADVLDYSKSTHGIFVCVGGQKLSRGLTLEGLSVSYYGRHAKAIDTLLQMGRWFGYKKGWLDLCRVFTTVEIANDYIEAAIITEGFKREISQMNDNPNATPRTFGLTVKAANRLLPTARNKARNATLEKISFSSSLSQTLDFDKESTAHNLAIVRDFVDKHDTSQFKATRVGFSKPLFRNIPVCDVLNLLEGYKTPSSLIELWKNYIKKSNSNHELVKWTVILSSTSEDESTPSSKIETIGSYHIAKGYRTLRVNGHDGANVIKIRALTSPSDYIGFFPDEAHPNPKKYDWDSDPELPKYYTPENGILVIYIFDPLERVEGEIPSGTIVDGAASTIGMGIWFPRSKYYSEEYVYANPIEEERLHRDGDASK